MDVCSSFVLLSGMLLGQPWCLMDEVITPCPPFSNVDGERMEEDIVQ